MIVEKVITENPLWKPLEKIMFSDKKMDALKEKINQHGNGNCTSRDLKRHIIKANIDTIKELIGFIQYYYNQLKKEKEINQFTASTNDDSLLKDLEEKNILLEKVGIKVRDIHARLQDKMTS